MSKELKLALQALLRNREFRRFLFFVFQQGNMATNPFAQNALFMSHACGKLALAQEVFELLRTAQPEFFPDLMKEMHDGRYANTGQPRADDDSGADNE